MRRFKYETRCLVPAIEVKKNPDQRQYSDEWKEDKRDLLGYASTSFGK
jgi:hypothetical protein